MSSFMLFIVIFSCSLFCSIVSVLIWEKKHLYDCKGSIVMHGDEIYLCLTHEDKKAFESCHYATIRLEREKFHGFNET